MIDYFLTVMKIDITFVCLHYETVDVIVYMYMYSTRHNKLACL